MRDLKPNEVPLSIEGLVKKYGDFEAVKGVSFQVRPGEIFGLLGPNGAGKTSIISCITTLESPTQGRVCVFGEDVTKNPRFTKSQVGIVPQEIVQHGFFNVEEILTFHSGYYGIWKNKERIDYLLGKLGLWEHRKKKVKQLSGGMKRRLLIAKALVHQPKLLLLDEPTAGVDIELRESLWRFVVELKDEGLSILLTTHYLEEAENLCQRVGIIHHGELRYEGPTASVISQFTKREVNILLREAKAVQNPYLIEAKERQLRFLVPAELSVGKLLSQLSIGMDDLEDLSIKEGSLEEAFLHVLGSEKE